MISNNQCPSVISPTSLVFNAAGIPYSSEYDDIYHSADGGWQQAQHVFLAGNRLPERWQQQAQFVILEAGFGLGINFLATWAAWRADPQRVSKLHFVSIEKHPLVREDLMHALELSLSSLAQYKDLSELVSALCQQWPVLTPGVHRLYFDDARVVLTLVLGDVAQVLGQLQLGVDAFYLDGFSPSKNPQMWSLSVLQMLNRYAREGATIATYSCAVQVQTNLRAAGFVVKKVDGFASKRSMLSGQFLPPWRKRRYQPPEVPNYVEKAAVVIGAGIAGSTVAAALAKQGWKISVFEKAPEIAQATSAHAYAGIHPLLTRDDNLAARALRAGYAYALKNLAIHKTGCLQVAVDQTQATTWQAMLAQLQFDPQFAYWVDARQAEELSGCAQRFGGIWYAEGGWADMAGLCRQHLQTSGIQLFLNRCVSRLFKKNEVWHVWGETPDGYEELAQAPVVILANALDASTVLRASDLLESAQQLPLKAVRGQMTFAKIEADADVRWPHAVLCGQGYLLPRMGKQIVFGASYDESDADVAVRDRSHAENMQKLAHLFPEIKPQHLRVQGGFVGQRCVAMDHLPLIGAWSVPMRGVHENISAGLYTALGLGSRGLIWSALAAEILTSAVTGAPAPVEADLLRALDPNRFLLRRQKKKA